MSVDKESTAHIVCLTDWKMPSFSSPSTSHQKPPHDGYVCSGWSRLCPHPLSSSSLRSWRRAAVNWALLEGAAWPQAAPHTQWLVHVEFQPLLPTCALGSSAGPPAMGSLWGCWASWAPTRSPLLFWGALPHQPSALTSPQRLFSRGPGLRQRVTSWLSVSFSFLMFHKMKVWLTTDGVLDSLKLAGSQPSSRVGEVEKQAAGEDRASKGPGHPAAEMILSWRKVAWADLVLERCGWLRGD